MSIKNILRETALELGIYYTLNELRKSKKKKEQDVEQKKFYSQLITANDIVFDVGANIGQRSNIFVKLAKEVIAIEPQKSCVKHLESRFGRRKNIRILNIALDEVEGEATLFECDSHVTSSMSKKFIDIAKNTWFENNNWQKEVNVKTKTLDQIILDFGVPKFIKIDVEGYEKNVLRGLNQPIPFISFEYTTIMADEINACINILDSISPDYKYNFCVGEDLKFRLKEHVNSSVFIKEALPLVLANPSFGDVYAIYSK